LPTIIHPIDHTCGYQLWRREQSEMFDVTSINDIPEHMRPTFVKGVGYVGGIPFSQLPLAYHKFLPGRKIITWYDNEEEIIACPHCGKELEHYQIPKT
jgi:hypothetical protein